LCAIIVTRVIAYVMEVTASGKARKMGCVKLKEKEH